MGHKKSIGLKGGPNEYITDIFEFISIEGYKRNSPDVNNPVNIIESSNITMEGVDFPVRGYGNNGIIQDMIPGVENYNYGNADYVVEMPMAQDGGDPEMLFKDEYNTALTKEEKIEYETWVASESKKQDRDIMWDLGTYDIQGFWKSGDHMRMDKDNHGSDKWKKPNHPTFSDQSNYHNINGHVGGTWAEDGAYTPSDYTRTLYDKGYYKKLFGREPNRPEYLKLEEKQRGGGLLNKTMKCNSCGWSWKAADGGSDVSTCHKCGGSALPKAQDGGCTSCTESMRQKEGSYNKGKEYILDPRFKQKGGSIKNEETIYKDYINGDYKTSEEELLGQKVYDKLNRVYYRDAKKSNMSTANYIMTHILGNS